MRDNFRGANLEKNLEDENLCKIKIRNEISELRWKIWYSSGWVQKFRKLMQQNGISFCATWKCFLFQREGPAMKDRGFTTITTHQTSFIIYLIKGGRSIWFHIKCVTPGVTSRSISNSPISYISHILGWATFIFIGPIELFIGIIELCWYIKVVIDWSQKPHYHIYSLARANLW